MMFCEQNYLHTIVQIESTLDEGDVGKITRTNKVRTFLKMKENPHLIRLCHVEDVTGKRNLELITRWASRMNGPSAIVASV